MVILEIKSKSGSKRSARKTVEYIDKLGNSEFVCMKNFDLPEKDMVAVQMENTAAMNSKVADPIRHFTMSWPLADAPTIEQQQYCVDKYMEAAGYEGHQYYARTHSDTEHCHLHIIANRVHPEKYSSIDANTYEKSSMNYMIHERVARELELKFNFEKVDGFYWRIVNDKVVETTREQKREMIRAKRSKITDRALQSERYSGAPAFKRYMAESKEGADIRDEVRQILRDKNVTWQDIHCTLDKHNLRIEQDKHKRGLVVVDKSNPDVCHMPASEVHPGLSKYQLERKTIGKPYEPPAVNYVDPKRDAGYTAAIQQQRKDNPIYTLYQSDKSRYAKEITAVNQKYGRGNRSDQVQAIDRRTYLKIRDIEKRTTPEKGSRRRYLEEGKTFLSQKQVIREIAQIRAEAVKEKETLHKDYLRERAIIDERFQSTKGSYKTYLSQEVAKGNLLVTDEFERVSKGKVRVDAELPVKAVERLEIHTPVESYQPKTDADKPPHEKEVAPPRKDRDIEIEI